jgi:hypothetical protein
VQQIFKHERLYRTEQQEQDGMVAIMIWTMMSRRCPAHLDHRRSGLTVGQPLRTSPASGQGHQEKERLL